VADVYAFDSNIYIKALRDPRQLAILKRFLVRHGTRVRVNAIVAMELRAGARTDQQAAGVENLVRPYADRERVIVPTFEAFVQAGRVLSALAVRERMSAAYSPALTNDAVIAASCREADVVLVTENTSDFTAIKRHLRGFRVVDSTALSS
jgi:predicted nucleic acid-binding protein